jgi:hypothetical protein
MQRLTWLAGGLSSPAILIVVIWSVALLGVALGPIDYRGQPSVVVLTVIAAGLSLFLLGYQGGTLLFDRWFPRQLQVPSLSAKTLDSVVVATSLLGITGIALVALDRTMLSGVSNSSYAELLRCAPALVDSIVIKRTPLLYGGYALFSFGFISLVLFLLKGEQISGWPAALAQLSIVSPVGYALLYAGRMPILFMLVLIVAAILLRLGRGQAPLPRGHHLLLKSFVAAALFGVYSSSIWSSRQNFCIQMTPLIRQLQDEKATRDLPVRNPAVQPPAMSGQAERGPADRGPAMREQTITDRRPATAESAVPQVSEMIEVTDLSKRLAEAKTVSTVEPATHDHVLASMLEAWDVKPRGYVTPAIQSGYLSPRIALTVFGTSFYFTHGVRTIDMVWKARHNFTPQWGVYQVGVLSPLLRQFLPSNRQLATMEAEQKVAEIYGFFPTVWAAAFIDFGIAGAVIYILIWGAVAGWSAAGSRHSGLVTPLLLHVFVLGSILLSPVQAPLGAANSALVLGSMLVVGVFMDAYAIRTGRSVKETYQRSLTAG